MITNTYLKSGPMKFLVVFLILTCIFLDYPGLASARRGANPPGPAGGPGRGPAWRDNPNKIDNPPGPVGGRGTDWGNPPGPAGGPGRGPAWRDNPNKIDNPPGPVGGPGAGRAWKQAMAERRVARLSRMKERMVANGAPPEKVAKIDERIQKLQQMKDQAEGQEAQPAPASSEQK